MEWRIMLMGPVGAGKTEAIRTISDIEVVDTDMLATDAVAALKSHTTVSMDVGVLHLGDKDKLRLYGSPGQDRFDFMWDILLDQSKGVILVIKHSSEDPLADLDHYARALAKRRGTKPLPTVVGITHTDQAPHRPLDMYARYFAENALPCFRQQPPILTMDARDRNQVRAALITMTAVLEMHERFARNPSAAAA